MPDIKHNMDIGNGSEWLRIGLRALPVLSISVAALLAAPAVQADDKPVTLTLWAGSYTPSRLLPTNNTPGAPAIKGIDPVVSAYEKLHPNVSIQLITQPINADSRRWLVTQLTGEVAPDIIWDQPDWANDDYRKNWLVPLDSYLDKPDPYVAAGQPGSVKWHDLFEPALDVNKAPDNHLYVLLGDQLQIGIYYNKDLFKKAGIADVPKNWEEFMDDADKLKQAGIFPFAESGNSLDQLTWVSGWLTQFFYQPKIATYDTNKDGVVSPTEMAKAVQAGTYSFSEPANRARLEQLKRFASYWQPGAIGADDNAARRLFMTGRAGMYINGSWLFQTIKQDKDRKFDFGVFYFPVLDSKTSKLVPDGLQTVNKAAGYGSLQYAVTSSATKDGNVDTAFDFLMFLTKPENLSPMITEAGFAVPTVKGAEANPDLAAFMPSIAAPQAPYQSDDSMFDFEFAQKFQAIVTPYVAGSQSLDDTVSRLDTEVKAAAARMLQQ